MIDDSIKLFKLQDAILYAEANMESGFVVDPNDSEAKSVFLEEGYLADVAEVVGDAEVLIKNAGDQNMSLVRVSVPAGFTLPLHSHSCDCLYLISEGSIVMGKETLKEGEGFLVRADAPYAYMGGDNGATVLEFRACSSFASKIVQKKARLWQSKTSDVIEKLQSQK